MKIESVVPCSEAIIRSIAQRNGYEVVSIDKRSFNELGHYRYTMKCLPIKSKE